MAKVIFMNSILSGRLGGLVYAFNKAGNYVRTFRKPTDPATGNQINNRALFANAVTAWHGLSDTLKGEWNTFAATVFKPKFGQTGVAYSGYNAFVSTQAVAKNMFAKSGVFTGILPPMTIVTPRDYTPVERAPLLGLSSSIQDSLGLPLGFRIKEAYITLTVGFSFIIKFDRSVTAGVGGAGPKFNDVIGNIPVGLAFVASLPVSQNEQFVKNPEINLISVIPPIGETDNWTTGDEVECKCDFTPEFSTRKNTYQAGDIVQVKCYVIGQNGTTQPLTSVMTTVVN